MRGLILVVLLAFLCAGAAMPVAAQTPPARNASLVAIATLPPRDRIAPVRACESLKAVDFSMVRDAPFKVQSATVEPGVGERPAFCLVKGYVAPAIQFELRLPTTTYTGRYLQGGCGGNCGMVMSRMSPNCDTALAYRGDFAVGFENSGHVGGDGVWSLGQEGPRVDFAYRAAHVFALAAKAVVNVYYGRLPAFSYFQGCSDGGREAMMETQRYPGDFKGVIAGSPAFAITEALERFVWEARWGLDAGGHLIFDDAAAKTLHQAVLKACDGLDGAVDGQIDDPRRCAFDPAQIQCSDRLTQNCLTAAQVFAARKFYQGPVDEHGRHLFYGGDPYGAELTWGEAMAMPKAGVGMFDDAVRDMVFQGDPPGGATLTTWRFDHASFEALRRRGAIYDANDEDLRPFRDQGGKLILWQGFADPAAGPYGLPDYYARLASKVGGLDAERQFARMFLIPGVYHCGGGYVPYDEDLLGAAVRWVELGEAPDEVMASAPLDGAVRRRLIYAYPDVAKYKGVGDLNDPASFMKSRPSRAARDVYDWAGAKP